MIGDAFPKPVSATNITARDLGDIVIYAHSDDSGAVRNLEAESPVDQLAELISILAEQSPIFFIDVGCNYGVQLCRTARHIASLTDDYRIIGMDPGRAGELIPYTLMKNGLSDKVTFLPVAAWKEAGVVEVFSEEGNSLNNRIVKGNKDVSWIASALTLSHIFDDLGPGADQPLFAKIDTQGADLEVLIGARQYLPQLIFVSELVPWACGDRIDIPVFIETLKSTHAAFDLGATRDRCEPIDDVKAFVKRVYEEAPFWTDFLCVPHRFASLIPTKLGRV